MRDLTEQLRPGFMVPPVVVGYKTIGCVYYVYSNIKLCTDQLKDFCHPFLLSKSLLSLLCKCWTSPSVKETITLKHQNVQYGHVTNNKLSWQSHRKERETTREFYPAATNINLNNFAHLNGKEPLHYCVSDWRDCIDAYNICACNESTIARIKILDLISTALDSVG